MVGRYQSATTASYAVVVLKLATEGLVDLFKRWIAKIAAPAHEAVAGLPDVERQADVRFIGRATKGYAQVRGNGTLALTPDALRFYMWRPFTEILIPLADILEVDTARRHTGKYVGATLLRVRFREHDGEEVIAWQVDDLEAWLQALDPKR